MILAAKGKDKEAENSSNRVSKKNISLSIFVNFPANMSYTLALGSKEVYIVSSTWGPKTSNNR
jgi:CO dehydrogenase/acetyl-CoA synthase delta subunit